jgi:putative acetyltransferase
MRKDPRSLFRTHGSWLIKVDDLRGPDIAELLNEHLEDMKAVSPPESKHALDLEGLRKPEITFWTLWEDDKLAGCGALKELDARHGEVKSMRTAAAFRRRSVAAKLLHHMLDEAQRRGYHRLSLETGSMDFFGPARRLYASFGFEVCAPFADYKRDPNSIFMTKVIPV